MKLLIKLKNTFNEKIFLKMFGKNKKYLKYLFVLALFGLFFVLFFYFDHSISVNPEESEPKQEISEEISRLSGLACQNYNQRSLAVVLASDPAARPLAGLSVADLVIEMPVITGSITRMLAFYTCAQPNEIGSLRSARHDFIPLAQGMDAILVHWGGSHFALDKLDNHVMDNINALTNPFNSFYRKNSKPEPHNGFTSLENLLRAAEKFNYRLENNFEGYLFDSSEEHAQISKVLRIHYSRPYLVSYRYDPKTNSYLRFRDYHQEIDANNNQQVAAKNIVIMRVKSVQIEGPDYNDLDLEGKGECQVYKNGWVEDCFWQKSEKNPKSKLKFIHSETNQEISFIPGQVWIEIVEPGQKVEWE